MNLDPQVGLCPLGPISMSYVQQIKQTSDYSGPKAHHRPFHSTNFGWNLHVCVY